MCVKVSGTGEPFCAACKNGEAAVIPLEAEQTAFVALCGLPGLLDPADVATAFRLTSAGKPKAASVGLLELASGLPAGARVALTASLGWDDATNVNVDSEERAPKRIKVDDARVPGLAERIHKSWELFAVNLFNSVVAGYQCLTS